MTVTPIPPTKTPYVFTGWRNFVFPPLDSREECLLFDETLPHYSTEVLSKESKPIRDLYAWIGKFVLADKPLPDKAKYAVQRKTLLYGKDWTWDAACPWLLYNSPEGYPGCEEK